MNEFPAELQKLFKTYGETQNTSEPSADFMPQLWARIEARRSPVFAMRTMARFLVAGAMAAALIMGAVLIPLSDSRRPAGHYADVVEHDNSKSEYEYAASLPLPLPAVVEAPRQ